MHTLPGYEQLSLLYQGHRTLIYRAVRVKDNQPVAIKFLRSDYPTFAELVQFRHQYTLVKNLYLDGIIHAYSLESYGNSYALIMEDMGGISLKEYTQGRPLPLNLFFPIAQQIVTILDGLIRARVIHKDIKPANILIHPTTQHIKLIDFSIATLLPRETQEIKNPNILEGTLAYLSPEQTGRMNRGIDYRSDFYSLGVTFYELLTGQLPFASDDPMELVHSHIAKQPPPVIGEAIPPVLSNIVMKLMAKNAEDRYQSALGLKGDLDKCWQLWQATGNIETFELGERDQSDRFLIPEKLYGRDTEVATLLAAFERVSQGSTELMLVAGFSGIGKTAVVNEVHKPIVEKRGYFIKGKFDQLNRNIPLSAFVQAFRDLMGQLLSESDTQLEQWKAKIINALGENGQVLIDVIPELEFILGEQPAVPELSGSEAQNRFNRLFQQFIQVFTTASHPLVIFLDDLQWADLASFKLMEVLVTHPKSGFLLLMGAYRDNEVNSTHPLMLTVNRLYKAAIAIHTLTLAPLSQTDINQLIADTLSCSTALALPLTQLVDQKTNGNPFFTTQLLKSLHSNRLIQFDGAAHQWQCDLSRVKTVMLSDNVVEFMALQLQALPSECQEILKLAACIGNQFDLLTLAIVCEKSDIEIATDLWVALQQEFVLPQNEIYKFFHADVNDNFVRDNSSQFSSSSAQGLSYKFLHDRIQQAAYSLIAADQKQSTHLKIGQLLLRKTSAAEREERLFEIVNHLNISQSLITQPSEREELTQLNLIAGQKAKAATAYAAAIDYLKAGIALLPDDQWNSHYNLTLVLHQEITEAAYLNLDFEQMEQWGTSVLQHARTLLDSVKIYETKMMAAKSQGQLLASLQIGLQVLQSLGVEFPQQPNQADIGQAFELTQHLWEGRHPLSLLDLPTMNDPYCLAAMRIMTNMIPSAYMAAPTLMPLLIFKQVELSIQSGNCAVSTFSYADYGLILCGVMGNLEAGYEFGQLALKVLDKFQVTPYKCRAGFIVQKFIRHWKDPLPELLSPLLEAYQSGLATGDLESIGMTAFTYCYYSYFSGKELTGLAEEMNAYRQTLRSLKQEVSQKYLEIAEQTVLNLLGNTEITWQLTGSVYNAAHSLPLHHANRDRTSLFHFYFNQTVLYYLFEHYSQAAQESALVEQHLDGGLSQFAIPLYSFYDALIHLALYREAAAEQQPQILARVEVHQQKMQRWATLAPFNHQHRWELIEAERDRILGKYPEAFERYDRAIGNAKTNGYIQDEALANELAAKFYLEWGKTKLAQAYMMEAYYCYTRWAAKAKVSDLETRYPQLLTPILQQPKTSLIFNDTLAVKSDTMTSLSISSASSTHASDALDLAAILKASQTLSGEIYLNQLISKLMQIVLQNAGAKKGVLLLSKGNTWMVEAIATLTPFQAEPQLVLVSTPLDQSSDIPHKLIYAVKHTLAPLVFEDITQEPTWMFDPYVLQQQPKSVLGLPILNQGNLIGILYLENRLTVGAFTSDRVALLNLLCTQAAISLRNAQLYQQTQTYAQQLERSLEELQMSKTRFQKVADNLPGIIFQIRITAESSSTPYISSGCYDLYEVSAEEMMAGKYTLRQMEHPDDASSIEQAVSESAQNLTPFRHEWRIITPSGKLKWIQVASRPERQADGSTLWDGVMIDISDRKAAEAERDRLLQELSQLNRDLAQANQQLEEYSQTLEQKVEERTAQLQAAQKQIIAQEKLASLGALTAGIAHEIRNPLNFVNNFAETSVELSDELLAELESLFNSNSAAQLDLVQTLIVDLKQNATTIHRHGQRAANIIENMLMHARMDTGERELTHLNTLVTEAVQLAYHSHRARDRSFNVTLESHYDPHIGLLEVFPSELSRALINLIDNACYSLRCKQKQLGQDFVPTLSVRTCNRESEVAIHLHDNGQGMAPEIAEKIFHPFFTTKPTGEGTGLGLSLTHEIIVGQHRGQIQVNSQLGEFAEFLITLPKVTTPSVKCERV